MFGTRDRAALEVTAFERPRDLAEHFRTQYGPTIATRGKARRIDREGELDDAPDRLFEDWNRGDGDRARFEIEYLVAIGTRA